MRLLPPIRPPLCHLVLEVERNELFHIIMHSRPLSAIFNDSVKDRSKEMTVISVIVYNEASSLRGCNIGYIYFIEHSIQTFINYLEVANVDASKYSSLLFRQRRARIVDPRH